MIDEPNINDVGTDTGQLLPGAVPTEPQIGTYQAQFNSIRAMVCAEVQQAGAEYAMSVQKLVRTCIGSSLQIASLAEQHCNNLLQRFQASRAKLVSHTTTNAMFSIDDNMLLVDFDLAKTNAAIQCAKLMQPPVYDGQLAITSGLLLLKQIQVLMFEPIDKTSIVIPYEQCMNSVAMARKQLERIRETLRATIASRAYTAFNFDIGLSLYTLNFSDDMSMLFWDRYTITEVTMKSYYIEQHCIVEHTIDGRIEPERFIGLHKPSKNNTAQFLADRFACLTSMVRPVPNMDKTDAIINAQTVIDEEQDEQDEDDLFNDAELIEMGLSEAEIEQYHKDHNI